MQHPTRPRSHRIRRTAAAATLLVALVATACTSDEEWAGDADQASTPTLDAATVAGSGAQLDAIVEATLAATGVPGAAVGVVHDGRVVLARGYGVREAGTDTPVSAETVFQIASLSKPVGATAVAAVVGRGELDWDQPVVSELPDFALSDPYVTQNVTVADFYSHRSGLPGATAGNDLERLGYDQAGIIDRLRTLPLGPFRAEYSYSNFGMTIGGLAAAAAYGAPFPQMAEEVLFGPAGMTSTSFSHDDLQRRGEPARLHVRVDGEFTTGFERDPDAQAPAGGVSSNVADLSRWMLLNLDEGRLDGEQLVDPEALAETKRSHINRRPAADPTESIAGYGLGWELDQAVVDPALVEWAHNGEFTVGASTAVRLYPELDLGIVVLTNAQPVGATQAIASAYLDTLLNGRVTRDWIGLWGGALAGLLQPPPREVPAAPAAAADDARYVGIYSGEYLGDVEVRRGARGLELLLGPDGATVLQLEHLDGDTFTFVDTPEISGSTSLVAFDVEDGATTATALTLGESLVFGAGGPATPWTTLSRQS